MQYLMFVFVCDGWMCSLTLDVLCNASRRFGMDPRNHFVRYGSPYGTGTDTCTGTASSNVTSYEYEYCNVRVFVVFVFVWRESLWIYREWVRAMYEYSSPYVGQRRGHDVWCSCTVLVSVPRSASLNGKRSSKISGFAYLIFVYSAAVRVLVLVL